MSLQIHKLSHALGAEITGVDLREPFDDKTFGEIHRAFLDHLVLLFRGQHLTKAQYVAFCKRFGETDDMSVASHTPAQARVDAEARQMDPEFPEIFLNTNRPKPGGLNSFGYYATIWHTDRPHLVNSGMASVVRTLEVPEVGGDTLFANMYLAYESLSDGMKTLIAKLYGVHTGGVRTVVDEGTADDIEKRRVANRAIAHPVARTHPETGRKSIFIAEKVEQFVGMTKDESKPLVQFLCKHSTRPQFVYRHQWKNDDLVMWDNRCTLHLAVQDYDRSKVRVLERVCIKGTASCGGYAIDEPLPQ